MLARQKSVTRSKHILSKLTPASTHAKLRHLHRCGRAAGREHYRASQGDSSETLFVFSSARAAPNLPAKLAIGRISRSPRPPSPAGFIVEYSLGANPLLHDLIEEWFPVHNGLIEIPDRAGLGITIRKDFLAARTVK
jgi:hypothetical protein